MCSRDQQMGRVDSPYLIDTGIYPEQDVTGDLILVDHINGRVVDILPTEASETTKQSNWLPILIISAITLFALKGIK